MERGRRGGRDARAPGDYLSLCSSTNSYTKLPVPAASENSLMTTPLAQPAPAPLPGVASVVAPTVQFEGMPAPVQGSMRLRSWFALEESEIVGPAMIVPLPFFS